MAGPLVPGNPGLGETVPSSSCPLERTDTGLPCCCSYSVCSKSHQNVVDRSLPPLPCACPTRRQRGLLAHSHMAMNEPLLKALSYLTVGLSGSSFSPSDLTSSACLCSTSWPLQLILPAPTHTAAVLAETTALAPLGMPSLPICHSSLLHSQQVFVHASSCKRSLPSGPFMKPPSTRFPRHLLILPSSQL